MSERGNLLERLAQTVDEILRALTRVPLGVAQEAGPIVDEADQQRLDPLTPARQHLARAMVEVQVHQLQDVLDLVAADLALLKPFWAGPGTPVSA